LIPRIYPITDTSLSGLSHAEQTARLIDAGATLIQLREKRASPREFYGSALEALGIARERGVRVIINDRVDIALVTKADGVHLGQNDMPPEKARSVLGDKAIIGVSTHTIEQVVAAAKLPVDYIAFGPIFGTTTKADPERTVGLEGLKQAREAAASMPLVAIGGIDDPNILDVFAAGADSAAIIGAIVSHGDAMTERMRLFNDLA
jgi:thiamine-phosphate pyrophosphorylase